jgi:hypothetical protein
MGAESRTQKIARVRMLFPERDVAKDSLMPHMTLEHLLIAA